MFLDSTNLVIGPGSETTLDEFVYSGPTEQPSAQKMQVSLTRGVFRFTTGTLDKKAYLISTQVASIAVQGTVLDIDVGGGLTRVTLVEGRALVCPRRPGVTFEQQQRACAKAPGGRQAPGCDCVELNDPGQTAQVKTAGGSTRASLSSTPVDFAPLCASASLCAVQRFASAAPGCLSARIAMRPLGSSAHGWPALANLAWLVFVCALGGSAPAAMWFRHVTWTVTDVTIHLAFRQLHLHEQRLGHQCDAHQRGPIIDLLRRHRGRRADRDDQPDPGFRRSAAR